MEKRETPQQRYDKANMGRISAKYKKEFIKEFDEACKKLGLVKSQVYSKAMQEVIDQAKKK